MISETVQCHQAELTDPKLSSDQPCTATSRGIVPFLSVMNKCALHSQKSCPTTTASLMPDINTAPLPVGCVLLEQQLVTLLLALLH